MRSILMLFYFIRISFIPMFMAPNTFTEEEFKQLLKNLFAEKKKVRELQKQLEDKGIQKKFQTALTDIHKLSLTEEYAKLKQAYFEKEKEAEHLKKQFEKVRPALKKLIDDLKCATSEVTYLKAKDSQDEVLLQKLSLANQKIHALEEDKQRGFRENQELQKHILLQEEKLHNLHKINVEFEEKLQEMQLKMHNLSKVVEDRHLELARVKTDALRELKLYEEERTRLVEKLANSMCQIQRQTDMLANLQSELENVKRSTEKEQSIDLVQKEGLEKNTQLMEFEKMRKTYEQMAEAFANLKNILGNSLD